jgi:hypothetical protein
MDECRHMVLLDPIESSYLPVKALVGSVVIKASPTINSVQYLQNKSGTIAPLDDACHVRDTVVLPEGTTMVDWIQGLFQMHAVKRPQIILSHGSQPYGYEEKTTGSQRRWQSDRIMGLTNPVAQQYSTDYAILSDWLSQVPASYPEEHQQHHIRGVTSAGT